MDFEKKVNKNKVADHDEDVHDDASEEEVRIGKGETKAVNALKLFVVVLLVIVAGGVSGTVYHFGREHENEIFRSDFQDHADKVIESFKHNSFRRKEALDSLAGEIELFAKTTGSEWPNIVMPDFEKRAAFAVLLSNVMSITFMPFVHSDKLAAWESFSVQHQDWLPRSLSKQGHVTADNDEENLQVLYDLVGENEVSIPPHVYSLEEPEMHVRHQANLYLPWWQFYPAFPVSNIVNTDLYTDSTMTEGFNAFFDAGTCITGAAWDASSAQGMRPAVLNLFLNRLTYPGVKSYTYEAGPISDIYVSVKDGEGDARGLVGALTASIYWQVYFENVLPDNARGVIARLENSCGQAYTFEINGAAATYLGEGDLHNPAYDDMAVSTGMGAFLGKYEDPATLHPGHCIYGVTVYPSSTMENIYRTREPVQFTLILISTFGVTCLVFLLYDCVVEKRQKVVMKTAVRSTKVVQSLFPAVVRERLYEGDATHSGTDAVSETFLDPEMTERSSDSSNSMADDGGFAKSTAIADLYPNCTVLFADIAGFTAWSAGRQPTEVFRLLETIYGVFDKIAKRRGVFKIETIGDCYVAVTGLPNAQSQHATIMAEFAHECMKKMHQMLPRLSQALGPDTLTLQLRFGLHSGAVTAGVLRGAKARFQLFGDTVNTASRMESTGVKGKIQASDSTAHLLVTNGKRDWVVPREEKVHAKGKGELQTYWLNVTTDEEEEDRKSENAIKEYISRHKPTHSVKPLASN